MTYNKTWRIINKKKNNNNNRNQNKNKKIHKILNLDINRMFYSFSFSIDSNGT